MGYEARIVGSLRAQLAHYPEIRRKRRSIARWPWRRTMPGVSQPLGAWHIEVVRNGGSLLARALYGARLDTGEDYFRRAFAADPKNLVIRFQYALSLSGYDFDAYAEGGDRGARRNCNDRTAHSL